MIILIGSQKGGVGKSTLAVNIAGELAQRGGDVVLVDADPQLSAATWHQYRQEVEALTPVHCVSAKGHITKTLQDLQNRYQHVVVDVAGRDAAELRSGMVAADLLVAPMRPSQFDLDTIPHLSEVFSAAQAFNQTLRGLLVLNLCPVLPTIKEADLAEQFLADIDTFQVAKVRLHERKAFRDAVSQGRCVAEWRDQKASQEIQWLVNEITQTGYAESALGSAA